MPDELISAQVRTSIANDIAQRKKMHQATIARLKAAEAHARTFRAEIPLKTPLVMLALGDSWFNYPLDGNSLLIFSTTDIIAQLQTMGGIPPVVYNISHYGDATTDELALPKQQRMIEALQDPYSGTITTWIARHLDMRGNQQFSCSGNLATMACGLPYAIAAAVAYPSRQSVAFVGDGGLTMPMGELATCTKYGSDVKVVVVKNNSLGQIKWEQMVFLGNPEFGCELQPIDFAGVARACGVQAFFIAGAEKCGETLRQALATPGPVLIEAVVDPNEPPPPPKVTVEQAKNFAESLLRGTPHAGEIALTVASDTVREVV